MEISEDEVRRLVDEAVEDDPTALLEVARLRPELIAPHHLRLLDADVGWTWDLYRGMTGETAAELVRRVDAADPNPTLVYALAAAGTPVAVEAIRRWARDRPAWTEDFHGTVARAGHAGGWELDESGERRNLAAPVAYQLVPADQGVSGGLLGDVCGWCGLTLLRLLELDTGRATELLGRASGPVTVGTCYRCGCYADYYTSGGRFLDTGRPDFLGHEGDTWDLEPGRPLAVGPRRPTPFAGSAWETGGSTLGGTPDWIQDPAYPACPRCTKTMFYLGMVTGGDLAGESAEGAHYAFHDPDCGVSATVYQQS